jgi:hypothetical protein
MTVEAQKRLLEHYRRLGFVNVNTWAPPKIKDEILQYAAQERKKAGFQALPPGAPKRLP